MSKFHHWATKLLHHLPPETAHQFAMRGLKLAPDSWLAQSLPDTSQLETEVAGLAFRHPVSLAAGFDKHAQVFDRLGLLGFSGVEIGSVTLTPQVGNPKPRIFRFPDQRALINRMGFNSLGLEYVSKQLSRRSKNSVLGLNIGRNAQSNADYYPQFFEELMSIPDCVDYFVVNISSPNTAGLRELQHPQQIHAIERPFKQLFPHKPLWFKVAPDLSPEQVDSLCEYFADSQTDALIISNTSIHRDLLPGRDVRETGGLSGAPLQQLAEQTLRRFYAKLGGKIPLVASGGIFSGQQAYDRIKMGASLVQIYTAFIYEGPGLIARILREMQAAMNKENIKTIKDAIGKNT